MQLGGNVSILYGSDSFKKFSSAVFLFLKLFWFGSDILWERVGSWQLSSVKSLAKLLVEVEFINCLIYKCDSLDIFHKKLKFNPNRSGHVLDLKIC